MFAKQLMRQTLRQRNKKLQNNFIKFNCKNCNCVFNVLKKEHNRQIKKGRDPNHFFCSLSCSKKWDSTFNLTEKRKETRKLNLKKRKHTSDSFKIHLRFVKKNVKRKKWKLKISLEDLKNQWEKQKGLCAISNIPMKPLKWGRKKLPDSASVDRIDSFKEYEKENIQFVCYSLNLAKSCFSQKEMQNFINIIRG